MAVLPEDGSTEGAITAHRHAGSQSDGLDLVAQPACPECGTAMRDDPSGFVCGSCGVTTPFADEPSGDPRTVELPEFDGPSIHFG